MTLLVTGARGMVGGYFAALRDTFAEPLDLTDVDTLDCTDLSAIRRRFASQRYTGVVNLAAATDLDRAEREPDWAYALNVLVPWNLALAAAEAEVPMVHFSTVALFGADGALGPFSELDPPSPVNVYARTKLGGEDVVRRLVPRHLIVRPAWVMGGGAADKKFVGKLREKLAAGEPVRAVDDKLGSPTYAHDLVVAVRTLLELRAWGLYHVTNEGAASRYELALELRRLLGSRSEVSPARSDEFPLPAPRPPSEVSRGLALRARGLAHLMPAWQDALSRYLRELG